MCLISMRCEVQVRFTHYLRPRAAQIERYILHELYELDQSAREAFGTYQFNKGNAFNFLLLSPPSEY